LELPVAQARRMIDTSGLTPAAKSGIVRSSCRH
jgi:hypothetical protein